MPHPFPRHGIWRTWTTLHGLPSLHLHAVAQDIEGYLWAGSAAHGLGRFDGDEFRTYTTRHGLPSNRIYALLPDRQGRLWIGTARGGLCWYEKGTFHTFEDKRSVLALAEDSQGRVWYCGGPYMGYHDEQGLHDLSDGYVRAHRDQQVAACWAVVPDVEGRVWFGAGALVGYDGTDFRAVLDRDLPLGHEDNVAIGRHRQGGLWLSWGRRVWHYHDGRAEPTAVPDCGVVRAIRADGQGRTWFLLQTNGALFGDGEQYHWLTPSDGLVHPSVVDLWEDREGLLWYATWGGGLSCYNPVSLHHVPTDGSERETAGAQEAAAVLEDRHGRLWVGWGSEVQAWEDVRPDALPYRVGWVEDGCIRPAPVPGAPPAGGCLALYEDRQGRVWLGGSRGGTVWYDGQDFRLLPGTEGYLTWAMTETRAGALILGCTQVQEANAIRLLAYDGDELRCLYEATVNGWMRGLVETTDGDLWFALCAYGAQTPGDGLGRLRPDGEVRFYTTADGLADDHVEAVLVDHQGRIWAGTYLGLSCYDGKSFVTYTTDDGLPNDRVRCLYEDRKRRLWLGTDSGVCQYDRQTFQTIRAPQVVGVHQIRQDRAGRYWFAGANGVVQYTPGVVPPRVRLLGVLADDTYVPEGVAEVPVSSGQVIFVELPRLWARPEDIPELAVHFVQKIMGQHRPAPRVSRAAMELLQAHDWRPGNVGDLFYEMKRVVRVCGDEVRPEHLTLRPPQAPAPAEAQPVTLAESERRCILQALERSGWVVKGPRGAAAAPGIPVSTLRDRIRKMGLMRPENWGG